MSEQMESEALIGSCCGKGRRSYHRKQPVFGKLMSSGPGWEAQPQWGDSECHNVGHIDD